MRDFEISGDALPAAGDYWIILDSKDTPSCIARTVSTSLHQFKDITAEIALAEGEGDCTVGYWKRVHEEIYAPYLEKLGIADLQSAMVITEHFELVYKPG